MTLTELARQYVDMEPHVATLTRLAREAQSIVEFGVRTGVSTWALLDGLPTTGRMTSVDTEDIRGDVPERVWSDSRWTFICGDDRDVELPNAELVFIDTTHEYHHTLAELDIADRLGAKRIALHDWLLPDVEDAAYRFTRLSDWRLWLLEPSEWGLAVLAR